MRYITVLSVAAGTILSCAQSIAGPMGQIGLIEPQRSWAWVGTLSAGPVWENAGQTQTVYLTPNIVKTYAAEHTTHTLFDGEVFVGIQKELPKAFWGQIGARSRSYKQRQAFRQHLGRCRLNV